MTASITGAKPRTAVVDLRDRPLPFFAEAASNKWGPSNSPDAHSPEAHSPDAHSPEARRWQEVIGGFDGFIFVGAARAIEHLRGVGIELQTVSTYVAVHIGEADFIASSAKGGTKPMDAIEAHLLPAAKTALGRRK